MALRSRSRLTSTCGGRLRRRRCARVVGAEWLFRVENRLDLGGVLLLYVLENVVDDEVHV